MTKKNQKYHSVVSCVWSLTCSLSSIDQERNNISLFNVIDQLNIPAAFFSSGKPAPVSHEIITLWRRALPAGLDDEEMKIDVSIALIDPQGTATQQFLTQVVFMPQKRRVRLRLQVPGVVVTEPGDYVYRIAFKASAEEIFNESVREIPIDIKKI